MADRKISELSALTGANSADDDVLVIVDTSADETKKITLGELENALAERDFSFGDNDKLVFGAGSDLQIYSDGTNSWIEEHGGGDLYIEATNLTLRALDNTVYATFADAGASTIYHAGAQKFQTTSTGIDVTGNITVGSNDTIIAENNIRFKPSGALLH